MKNQIIILFIALVLITSCKKNDDGNGVATAKPSVTKLYADKDTIKFGGNDPCVITCEATGGNLSYEWYVDLGDIQPLNSDASKIRFTGSQCCLGDKFIKCTITNELGTTDTTKIIFIKDTIQ